MESLSWMSKILRGTINSENSSESHREKARKALNETIPSIVLHVALIEGLQRDLAQTIEDRDKYHKLADMLMDKMSDPASSEKPK